MNAGKDTRFLHEVHCAADKCGFSVKDLQTGLGLSRTAIYYKLRNPNRFTVAELRALCKLIGMPLVAAAGFIEKS